MRRRDLPRWLRIALAFWGRRINPHIDEEGRAWMQAW